MQIPIQVKYALTDPTGKSVICMQIGAKIIDPNPKKGRRKGGNKNAKVEQTSSPNNA
jgi:hypothetical protein